MEKQGGKEEFVELCGTSSVPSSSAKKKQSQQHQEKGQTTSAATSKMNAGTLKRTGGGTNSILKNAVDASSPSYCPVHSYAGSGNSPSTSVICTCQTNHSSSSLALKNFITGSSSSSVSSSSSLLGNSNIRSGIAAAAAQGTSSTDDITGAGNIGSYDGAQESDDGAEDMDDTTTGTGSDNSSFKWVCVMCETF